MKVRKAIIPAAGLGTRLLPNTKSIPKEMLPLVDKPVLQYIVEEAVAAGVEQILIITNRGKSPIEDYFDYAPDLEERLLKDGKEKEARTIRAVADMADVLFLRQKETKGLGHAVWRAKSFVGDEPFIIEINPRQGGNDLPRYVQEHCGIDYYKLLVTTSVGDDCYWDSIRGVTRQNNRITHHMLYPRKNGRYKNVSIAEKIKECVYH